MKVSILESINKDKPLRELPQLIPPRLPTVMMDLIVFCMQDKVADLQVRCVISFDGHVDAKRMMKAVRLTLDVDPILGCRFVDHWWRPYWERRNDLNQIKNCRLVKVTDFSQDLVSFMSTPINSLTDPLVQVCILRADTDTLCIKVDHMVADACGIKKYIYLLASIYRRLADNPGYVPAPNLGGSRSLRQISRRFGFLDKLRIIRSGFRDLKRRLLPPTFWSFPLTAGIPSNKTFTIRQFGPERFRAIKEYVHQYQATVNDIMLAAFYRSLFDLINPDSRVALRLGTTVDLRRYLPAGTTTAICNLSNFAYTNIGQKLGATFDETTVKVRKDMNVMKSDYIGLGDYPPAALCFRGLPFSCSRRLFHKGVLRSTKTGNAPPVFSNGGIIDSEQLVFDDVAVTDAYLIGATFFPPFFGIGLSCFNESLTLSISFFETAIKKSVVEHFLDRIEYELPE